MPQTIKINELDVNTGNYETTIFTVPYSIEKEKTKRINLNIAIKGNSPDDILANFKLLINELYKVKDESKDCILEIKADTTHSTFFEILNYEILMENLDIVNVDLFVDNFGYSASIEIGNAGSPHATKTLPDYFDTTASKGDVSAFTEFFMKLLSADDIYNIYYGLKSEKLISDITNFLPILEAEDIYFFDFFEDDGKWILNNATISGGLLNINIVGGYGQRIPDADWLSGVDDDFEIEIDFKQDSTPEDNTMVIYLYLVGDANPIKFFIEGYDDEMQIYYPPSIRAFQAFVDDTSGHTAKIRRVGTTYYYSIDGGSEISWDYGIARALEYINLSMEGCTGEFDDFKYYWVKQPILTNMTSTGDADCRGGNKAYTDATFPTAGWATYITFTLNNANYKGRYLVLVRCESESESDDVIKIRLKCGNLYNDEYSFKATDANLWRLIELGEIQVPYSETQAATSDYEIQLIGNAADRIGIDYIALIPIDESFGIRKSEVNAILQNEIYEIDTIKKIISTYVQDENDNNNYDRGNFVYLPKGDCRVVVVSDNNDENVITDQMAFWLNYKARYKFLRSD